MKKYFLLIFIIFFSISLNGQDKVVLRQTFIKVKPGIITQKTSKTKFGKMAQKELMPDFRKVGIFGKW